LVVSIPEELHVFKNRKKISDSYKIKTCIFLIFPKLNTIFDVPKITNYLINLLHIKKNGNE